MSKNKLSRVRMLQEFKYVVPREVSLYYEKEKLEDSIDNYTEYPQDRNTYRVEVIIIEERARKTECHLWVFGVEGWERIVESMNYEQA